MIQVGSHPWVREFHHRVGWGLQAFALPGTTDPGPLVMAAGLLADTLGFDAFFLGDHPAYAPEVWLHLGALAMQTSRVRLGSVVLCAGYRPPVLTARLAADLDNLSGGRAILGLGHGWNATEFAQLGLPFPARSAATGRIGRSNRNYSGCLGTGAVHLSTATITTPSENGSCHRRYNSRRRRSSWPAAANAPRYGSSLDTPTPAISDRDMPRVWRGRARRCDTRTTCSIGTVEEVGRDPHSVLRTHFTSWLMVAPTEAAAQAKLDHYYPEGSTRSSALAAWLGPRPGCRLLPVVGRRRDGVFRRADARRRGQSRRSSCWPAKSSRASCQLRSRCPQQPTHDAA